MERTRQGRLQWFGHVRRKGEEGVLRKVKNASDRKWTTGPGRPKGTASTERNEKEGTKKGAGNRSKKFEKVDQRSTYSRDEKRPQTKMMIMKLTFMPLPLTTAGNIASNRKRFKSQWKNYETATDFSKEPKGSKKKKNRDIHSLPEQ